MNSETDRLWRWVGSVCTDRLRDEWCREGTNSGPTYPTIVNEDIVDELIDEKFGGEYDSRHFVQFRNGAETFKLYARNKIRKADGERGCMVNLHARKPGNNATWGRLRINIHVHFRTYAKMAELEAQRAKKTPGKGGWMTA